VAQVKVVTDSASDLPQDIATSLGIEVVPLTIRFGDKEYVDRTGLTSDEFWAMCKASKVLPETAAPSPGSFQDAYERAFNDGAAGVIVVTLSSQLSATFQSATLAADAVKERGAVRVIDSRAVSMAQGLLVVELAEAAKNGASLDDLVALANSLTARLGIIGTIDTLEHLIKGGRIGGAKALLGSVLNIKPLLELKEGVIGEAGRARTRAKAIAALVQAARSAEPLQRLAVMHGAATDITTVVEALQQLPVTHPLVVGDVGSTVGTHGGPGMIVVCWLRA
jgi:DegV family protein with EDD domain